MGRLIYVCLLYTSGVIYMIDFEEEIERFKPSLDVEEVEDAIVKSDLTDMTDIMMELIKERGERDL